jgi:hypothetical protein
MLLCEGVCDFWLILLWWCDFNQNLARGKYLITKNDEVFGGVKWCTVLLQKGLGAVVIDQVSQKMMLECNISVNLWYQENQMGPVILVALIAPHTPTLISVMALHNLTLDFLQTHACHSESSLIHFDETKVHR